MSDSDERPDDNDDFSGLPGEAEEAPEEASGDPATELATLSVERDKLKDQLLRTMADFDNFRKRARRDADDALRRGREDSLRDFLPIVDNLERAVDASRGATDVAAVISGIEMVLRSFDDIASRFGVARVPALGERFDPNLHDAIQQVETTEHAPGTVLTEVVSGYRIGERLLRAAMVVVAKAPSIPAPAPVPEADPE